MDWRYMLGLAEGVVLGACRRDRRRAWWLGAKGDAACCPAALVGPGVWALTTSRVSADRPGPARLRRSLLRRLPRGRHRNDHRRRADAPRDPRPPPRLRRDRRLLTNRPGSATTCPTQRPPTQRPPPPNAPSPRPGYPPRHPDVMRGFPDRSLVFVVTLLWAPYVPSNTAPPLCLHVEPWACALRPLAQAPQHLFLFL